MKWWILFFVLVCLVEIYAYQAVKVAFDNKWLSRIYALISLVLMVFITYLFSRFDRSVGQNQISMMTMALLLLVYVPKILVFLFLFTEDIFRMIGGSIQYFSNKNQGASFLPARRQFLSQIALAAAMIPFSSLVYGIFKGRFNYRVIKQTVFFEDLPEAFDGFKILQLSDLHCGSFDQKEKIEYGVDLINQQDFDALVFTGDLVNSQAAEMDDWYAVFSKIKQGKFGNYSILGNHDYGEYLQWDSEKAKQDNFAAIKAIHPKLGWDLLLNEHRKFEKDGQEIFLIGVENWGAKFRSTGDLKKASEGIEAKDFKILLSHDPSHWELEAQPSSLHYQLTLSGHTHGMQFGIEIPGWIKWSPVQYVYQYWAGLYEKNKRFLYVNRGFGYHAYPGRVGIWPEITLIELKKKVNA